MTVLRKRKIRFLEFETNYTTVDDSEEKIDEIDFQFKVDKIIRAVNQLPQGYRLIVQLYLFESMPQEEIGKVLGISHITVRTQYHRAKKRLLELIKKGDDHEK